MDSMITGITGRLPAWQSIWSLVAEILRRLRLRIKDLRMTTASNVAKYFLTLSQPDEGDYISNLKLQKLVYYAQGFHVALFNKPLFDEPIHAWEHGPVVKSLYHEYKEYGSNAIPIPVGFDCAAHFSNDELELLNEVWNVYGQFSAWKLRNMTHEEPPWKEAVEGAEISRDSLRSYFKTLVHA